MKKIIIPLMTVAVVAALLLGCMPGAPPVVPPPVAPPVTPPPVAPPVTPPPVAPPAAPTTAADIPELNDLVAKGAIDPNLLLNPFGEDLAVKPDGTRYKFASTMAFEGCDWLVHAEGLIRSYITRAGGDYIKFDPNLDVQKQIGFIEDLIAVKHPDALIIHAVDEAMMGPSIDQLAATGCPIFAWDLQIHSENVTCFVQHDFDGEAGSCVLGEHFVKIAEETGKEINIYEVWGVRAQDTCLDRHEGFNRPLEGHPLITVTESPDCEWSDEIANRLVMDAFTAHPELNGLYVQGGGSTGAVQALRGIGRLLPFDDPNHVVFCNNDCDTAIVEGMLEGSIDALGSHGPYDLCGTSVVTALLYVCCGASVPEYKDIPMVLVTYEDVDARSLFRSAAAYPVMPAGQWDLWPVMDTSEIGIPFPTKELRMQLLGY